MTAPYPDEAARAVADAEAKHRPMTSGIPGVTACTACDWRDRSINWEHHRRAVGLTAAMPVLAEHFAQAVEAWCWDHRHSVDREDGFHAILCPRCMDAARLIRAAANPSGSRQCRACGRADAARRKARKGATA